MQSPSAGRGAAAMTFEDPAFNKQRLLADFIALSQRDAVGDLVTKVIEHSAQRDLIAVFHGEPDAFEVGRVMLFQEFVYRRTGIFPEVASSAAHCIKVFFDLGADRWAHRDELLDLFRSTEFDEIVDGLDLSYVQFAGEIFPPQRLNN